MATANYTRILNGKCTIQRKNVTGTDGGGQRTFSWVDLATDVACRKETTSAVEIVDNQKVVVESTNFMLSDGQVITEDHRIIDDDGTYSVLLVRRADDRTGSHHIEAQTDRVKPANA